MEAVNTLTYCISVAAGPYAAVHRAAIAHADINGYSMLAWEGGKLVLGGAACAIGLEAARPAAAAAERALKEVLEPRPAGQPPTMLDREQLWQQTKAGAQQGAWKFAQGLWIWARAAAAAMIGIAIARRWGALPQEALPSECAALLRCCMSLAFSPSPPTEFGMQLLGGDAVLQAAQRTVAAAWRAAVGTAGSRLAHCAAWHQHRAACHLTGGCPSHG